MMVQSFQCISCGRQNAFGEPVCTQCGQPFIYNCPICGSHINNRYDRCHGCGAAFYWGTLAQQDIQEKNPPAPIGEGTAHLSAERENKAPQAYSLPPTLSQPLTKDGKSGMAFQPPQFPQSKANSPFSSPKIWVTLIIICVVLIGVLLLVDWFINQGMGS